MVTDIPVKVLIDNILPFCETKDVLSLGCTNRFFSLVVTGEKTWRKKLAADPSSWKSIYQRFKNPRVSVWGCVPFSIYYATRC